MKGPSSDVILSAAGEQMRDTVRVLRELFGHEPLAMLPLDIAESGCWKAALNRRTYLERGGHAGRRDFCRSPKAGLGES